MEDVITTIETWGATLCSKVEVGVLFARNPIAHKWKAPWRSLLLRETVAWRLHDLLTQSIALHQQSHALGARILLRAAFETVAVLIHLNQAMRQVVSSKLDFHEFAKQTTLLLLGSRDKSTSYEAVNVLKMLDRAGKRYPGIRAWYDALCESAHPNYEGMLHGYSVSDETNFVTDFSNRWAELYGQSHLDAIRACMIVFDAEYNEEWPSCFEDLEQWIVQNDEELERTKPAAG